MGMDADGIFVYGFYVGGEEGLPEWMGDDEGFDFDDLIAGPYVAGCDYKARHATIEACPAELVTFCSYDNPEYILALRGTKKSCSWGESIEITSLDVDPARVAALKAWCEEKGIPWEQPKWLLASMWG